MASPAFQIVESPASISVAEQIARRHSIDSALGTTLAEGVSPGPEVLALAERYVNGELSVEEFGAAVRGRWGI